MREYEASRSPALSKSHVHLLCSLILKLFIMNLIWSIEVYSLFPIFFQNTLFYIKKIRIFVPNEFKSKDID